MCGIFIAILLVCLASECLSESPFYDEIQMVRAHNSYHVAPDARLLSFGAQYAPVKTNDRIDTG